MSTIEQLINPQECSPFLVENEDLYEHWKQQKLANYPDGMEWLRVNIQDPASLTAQELASILDKIRHTNIALYSIEGAPVSKSEIRALARQIGLEHLDSNLCADEDSITSLQVMDKGRKGGYIPYTNKRLSWHTDGYYNSLDQQVRAIVMHCVTPARTGGENMLLDHEMLYLHLREADPAYITTLMHPQAMTIPPNEEGGEVIRGVTVGPVFSIDAKGNLHMRYSARTRNIIWRDDTLTKQATGLITELLNSESSGVLRYRLNANEGIISNNVLHNRTAFEEDETHKRLLYRARFYDRVKDTDVMLQS